MKTWCRNKRSWGAFDLGLWVMYVLSIFRYCSSLGIGLVDSSMTTLKGCKADLFMLCVILVPKTNPPGTFCFQQHVFNTFGLALVRIEHNLLALKKLMG